MNKILTKEVAKCIGLWLAEGDKKTIREITFTNNCLELIILFHKTMKKLFKNTNPRIYVYYPKKEPTLHLDQIKLRFYKDKRARKPYFIYRIASTNLNKEWKKIVENIQKQKILYKFILQGFFAGEGNIKSGSHNNRVIRISQKQPLELINRILNHFHITYNFSEKEHSYVIINRVNWKKLAKIKIADLHPEKKKKFWKLYNDFKEWHYSHNYIKTNIPKKLKTPKTSKELSITFNRSQARIQEVLSNLKKNEKVKNFRVRSKDYWVNYNEKVVIISSLKRNYLNKLNKPLTTKQLSTMFNVDWKSSFNRMKELEKLGLVKNENYLWFRVPIKERVIVI